jgi:ssDNA-binding Zn-finger/Zn-ribbon topoisomerase 1
MSNLIIAVIFFIIIAVVLPLILKHAKFSTQSFPYQKQPSLFTPAERSFYGVLNQAVGADYHIFAKVRLADLFKVHSGLEAKDRLRAFNRISAKHIDFVLCDPSSLDVLAAIELDDKSHAHPKRKSRDEFVNRVFAEAGLPLGRIAAKKAYSLTDVRSLLSQILNTGNEIDLEENTSDFEFGDAHGVAETDLELKYISKSKPFCPACGNVMELSGEGETDGKQWICSKAPVCGEVMNVKRTA